MASDINQLAKKCGVSKATISRVFTGRARVSDAIRARVLAAAREMNYRPQQVMARDCVAIIVGDNPTLSHVTGFGGLLLTSAFFEITRRHLLTEVLPVAELSKLYDSYTRAVLVLLAEAQIEEHTHEFEQLPMPIVTVNKQYPFSSSVNTDHGQGVTLALEHLFERGHRRIGLTVDRFENLAGRERVGAYRTFMEQHKLTALPIAFFGGVGGPMEDFDRILTEKPTALIVCGEAVALQASHELKRRGLRIPEDISLITSELSGICDWLNPALTAINQDFDALARETVAELVFRIHNPAAPRTNRRLPSSLVVRDSVATLPF